MMLPLVGPYALLWSGLRTPGAMLRTVVALERLPRDEISRQALAVAYSFVGETALARRTFPFPSQEVRRPTGRRVDALDEVVRLARGRHVVVLSEAHHRPQGRTFTLMLLRRLRRQGFTDLAAETFTNPPGPFLLGPPRLGTGHYTAEPTFGQVVREARRLGYLLVPYESFRPAPAGSGEKALNDWRDAEEARNLVTNVFARRPGARVVIYCGYAHAYEAVGKADGVVRMATRLRRTLGRDLLTLDLATMPEVDVPAPSLFLRASGGYAVGGDPAGLEDAQVWFPRTHLRSGRPDWLLRGTGRRLVRLPFGRPGPGRYMVEAVPAGEPTDAVPTDRVLVWPGRPLPRLALPRGRYRATLWDEAGRQLMRRCLRV